MSGYSVRDLLASEANRLGVEQGSSQSQKEKVVLSVAAKMGVPSANKVFLQQLRVMLAKYLSISASEKQAAALAEMQSAALEKELDRPLSRSEEMMMVNPDAPSMMLMQQELAAREQEDDLQQRLAEIELAQQSKYCQCQGKCVCVDAKCSSTHCRVDSRCKTSKYGTLLGVPVPLLGAWRTCEQQPPSMEFDYATMGPGSNSGGRCFANPSRAGGTTPMYMRRPFIRRYWVPYQCPYYPAAKHCKK
jgi:hypothetical protein